MPTINIGSVTVTGRPNPAILNQNSNNLNELSPVFPKFYPNHYNKNINQNPHNYCNCANNNNFKQLILNIVRSLIAMLKNCLYGNNRANHNPNTNCNKARKAWNEGFKQGLSEARAEQEEQQDEDWNDGYDQGYEEALEDNGLSSPESSDTNPYGTLNEGICMICL